MQPPCSVPWIEATARRREARWRSAHENEGEPPSRGETAASWIGDIIGHRSRLSLVEALIEYIRGHDGVWFATHEEAAGFCLSSS